MEEQEHSEAVVVVVEALGHLLTAQEELAVVVLCVKVLTWWQVQKLVVVEVVLPLVPGLVEEAYLMADQD